LQNFKRQVVHQSGDDSGNRGSRPPQVTDALDFVQEDDMTILGKIASDVALKPQ
jgi:hypothetical protein